MSTPRKIKYIKITPEIVLDMLRSNSEHILNINGSKYRATCTGLPEDVQVVNSSYDILSDAFVMTIESKEFLEVLPCNQCDQLQLNTKLELIEAKRGREFI